MAKFRGLVDAGSQTFGIRLMVFSKETEVICSRIIKNYKSDLSVCIGNESGFYGSSLTEDPQPHSVGLRHQPQISCKL